MRCPRCRDWRTDPTLPTTSRQQLAEHAIDVDHPCCSICARILALQETATCEECLTESRAVLAGIRLMWEELPAHLTQLRGSWAGGRGGSDGRPLPGGDALVLLGPGSEGWAEDGETSREGDATSVVYELTWWESAWRAARNDPQPQPRRLAAAIRSAAGYLEIHTRWAAEQHPGFCEYMQDLHRLHGRLERATGRARAAARANADCFDCGGQLIRRPVPVKVVQWWLPNAIGPVRPGEVRTALGAVDSDDVTCDRCRRAYSPAEYALALRATRDSGLQGWVSLRDAAVAAHRSIKTMESWITRGLVEVACLVSWHDGRPMPGRQVVWWPDVDARTACAQRRSRAS